MITGTSVYFLIVGALTSLVIIGAKAWAGDLGLKMSWWKWLLAAVWYLLLIFFVFLDFTLIGEGETAAGLKMLLFQGVILIFLGVVLVRVLLAGRTGTES
jgi:hypothetical protein